ncbi:glycosyltransferase [Lacticaseibacillus rhamnosus]|uniref:glycosyltransferase n=1 Tax=Lacticaseibacillus rhamnosus TaxID=47715 RepID=UPI0007E25353|nr:glycosyltransferase [Lacticaseibacillus rhamnosus]OAU24804.1 glycosyl transferase [Lacticaseibacillus rhamnosus]
MQVLLSMIIPVFNIQKELKVLLNQLSLIRSTEIEIILVDDGSTDGSSNLVDKFAKKSGNGVIFPRTKVIHLKNSGLSVARNRGMEISNGKYIWFIDGDDLIDISKIDQIIKILREDSPEIFQFNYDRFVEDCEILSRGEKGGEFDYIHLTGNMLFQSLATSKIESFSWAHICKLRLYTENGIKFPEGKVFEDIATTYRLFLAASKCIQSDYPIYHYRNRSDSIMNDPSAQSCVDLFTVVKQAQTTLEKIPASKKSSRNFLLTNAYTAMMRTYEGRSDSDEKRKIRKEIQTYYLHLKVDKFDLRSLKTLLIKGMIMMRVYDSIQRKRGRIQ